jgi:uncharacterized small protein (DUF1192 family)
MPRNLYDYWVMIKYNLRIPLPIRNHFHKGKRIRCFEYWFCKSCHSIFFNEEWNNKANKHKRLCELENRCPHCNSESITASTESAKAIIEKQSIIDIIELIAIQDQEIKRIEARIHQKNAN